jgi:hypothetical protein
VCSSDLTGFSLPRFFVVHDVHFLVGHASKLRSNLSEVLAVTASG